jgi:hypothetical protein
MLVGLETALAANPLVQARQVAEGGAILFDSASGDCFELNRAAAEIWRRVTEGQSPRQAVDAMSSAYGVGRDSLEADVLGVLDDLVRRGLLTVARR